jgi:hypothetical protein
MIFSKKKLKKEGKLFVWASGGGRERRRIEISPRPRDINDLADLVDAGD